MNQKKHQKHKVILTQLYQDEAVERLKREFDLIIIEGSGKTLPEVLNENPDTEALVCFLSDKVDKAVIDMGKNLKVIANCAVGYNNIDAKYAASKGIPVTNTPDVLTDATADMAMALLLACARRIPEGEAMVRAGLFKGWEIDMLLGKALRGATLGIIGMGRIGEATAVRALGFGMNIIYFSRTRKKELENKYGFTYMDFLDVVKQSDFLSLHIPSSPEAHHLFNKEILDRMKKDAIFINVSRGDLVDEAYLAEKLEKNELFSAGLDVYEFEPKINEKLLTVKNAILLPHIGSADYSSRLRMAILTVDNVKRVLSSQPPITPVKEFLNR